MTSKYGVTHAHGQRYDASPTEEGGLAVLHAPAVGAVSGAIRRLALIVFAVVSVATAWLAIASSPAAAANPAPNDLGLRATYDATGFIHWSRGTFTVTSVATVTNTAGGPITRLTFNLITLRTGDAKLSKVVANGVAVTPVISGQTLVVPLPAPVAPGNKAHVTINYDASFNAVTNDRRPLFAKQNGTVTAYRWIPWLSRPERFATPNFGETWVTAVSPRVTVRLGSDVPVKFATTGQRTGTTASGATFSATNVRDFNFSAGRNYTVTRFAWHNVNVRIYSHTQSPSALKRWTTAALDRFDSKIGPYPYSHLTIAETPSGTGMESPQMTWIPATLSAGRLTYTIVHEAAHQWFYGVIGNNQATQPFLDEALADFLTRDVLHSFRTSRCAQVRLDGSVYYYSAKCYFEDVYVQGANYLRKYRTEVGSTAFWKGLSAFYRDHKFQISGTRTLLDYLDRASGYDSQRHAKRFPSLYP